MKWQWTIIEGLIIVLAIFSCIRLLVFRSIDSAAHSNHFFSFLSATLNGGPLAAGMVSEFRCIYKSDGLTGLYRGLAANFLKVAPAVAISYIVYENVRTTLGVKMT